MQIIGSQPSPFVRIVRITCEELNISYELLETGAFSSMTAEDAELINSNNPLMKVPVLRDQGKHIIDSRIIVNYLINKSDDHANPDFDTSINDEKQNLITIILGIGDAALIRFVFGKTTDLDLNKGYLRRSLTRIETGLSYLNEQSDLGKTFGVPELMLISLLDWFKNREIYDWSIHENLVATYGRYKDRDSIVNTRMPDNI